MAWVNFYFPEVLESLLWNGVKATDLLRTWSNKKMGANILWFVEAPTPQGIPQASCTPSVQGGPLCSSQGVQTEGQAREWDVCWPPAFPLSFPIMLIWLLLVTAILHYYYSFWALNHSDGYNVTPADLPNSSPSHFFNTQDKIGRFSNWLCNFLFSFPPALVGAAAKAFSKGLLGGEISCPFPAWPRPGLGGHGFALSLTL